MRRIKFADGMEIQIDGECMVTSKSDGLYIVSYGMCIPVDNSEFAEELLETLKSQ